MTVTACDSLADLKAALDSAGNKLVVIDFFATWCGPCRLISPAIQGWAAEMADVVFIKPYAAVHDSLDPFSLLSPTLFNLNLMLNLMLNTVDVDKNAEAAEEYDISAMPTFKLIKKGEVTSPLHGLTLSELIRASNQSSYSGGSHHYSHAESDY
ncbi:unnamed protein product [Chrysoparadoxa australica]